MPRKSQPSQGARKTKSGEKTPAAMPQPDPGAEQVIKDLQAQHAVLEQRIGELQQAGAFYRALVESIPGVLYSYHPNQGGMFYSTYVEQLLGYTPEQLHDQPMLWHDSIHPDDLPRVDDAIRTSQAGTPFHVEYRIRNAQGEWLWLDDRSFHHPSESPETVVNGFAFDITERRRAEQALRESEKNLKRSQQIAHIGHWIWDIPKNVVTWSDEMKRIFGLDPQTFNGDLNQVILNSIHPDDRERVIQMNNTVIKDGIPNGTEYRVVWQDGSVRHVWAEPGEEVRNPDGAIVQLSGIVQDITERKQTELALRESQEKLAEVFNTMEEGMALNELLYDEHGEAMDYRILEVNPAFERIAQISRQNSIGKLATEIYGLSREYIRNFWRENKHKRQEVKTDFYAESTGRWTHVSTSPVSNERFVTIFSDVTEQKRAEEELRKSEANLRAIFDESPQAFMLLNADHKVVSLNKVAQQWAYPIYGRDILPGTSINEFVRPGERQSFEKLFEQALGGTPIQIERNFEIGGATRWFEYRISPVRDMGGPAIGLFLVITDVTERKESELRLLESETRLYSIISSSRDAIGVSINGVHEFVNPAYEAMFGYERGELIGKSIIDLIAPQSRDFILQNLRNRQMGLPAPTDYEVIAQRKDGSTFHMDVGVSQYSLHGEPHTLVILRDISDRKLAEQKLLESEANLSALIENTDGSIWAVDSQYRLIVGNHEFHANTSAVLGRNLQPGESVLQAAFPESANREWQALYDRALRGERFSHETTTRFRSEARFVEYQFSPIRGADQAIRGATVYGRDITQRKQSEELIRQYATDLEKRVRERTAEVQDLYDNAPSGYHSLDEQGRIVRINQTELNWLGYTREELLERPFSELFTPESRVKFHELFPILIQKGRVSDAEMELIRKDGSILQVLANSTVIRDENGKFMRSRTSLFDISKRKEAEQKLHEANAALEKASRLKDEFLANMSHELRTPLNSIMGFSEILLEGVRGPINDNQKHAVQMIRFSGEHLLGLINDILDVSRIEAGKFEIHTEEVDANAICQASLELIRQQALKKSISLEYSSTPPAPQIWADPKRLKQVLVNLLNNAVKFTPENGTVKLEVRGNPQAGVIRFSIVDSGIGIAKHDLGKLFKPFEQLDSSLSRRHEGSGLGLTLVKKLVELHGGSVEVESEPGHGSRFTVTLDWHAEHLQTSRNEENFENLSNSGMQPASRTGRILIADDNEVNVMMLQDFLESLGHQVFVARHGGEVSARAAECMPDIILMDLQMPHVSGLEATRQLRADPRFASVTIIALTAFAMPGDRERCLEAGMNEYISKPFKLKEIREVLDGFLNTEQN